MRPARRMREGQVASICARKDFRHGGKEASFVDAMIERVTILIYESVSLVSN